MPIARSVVDSTRFNRELALPYELRIEDFQLAMQDAYDFYSLDGVSYNPHERRAPPLRPKNVL
ncbi:MAG: hypothetical protein Q8K99_14755 [Actinomycetota bacterium]|nr:hypothetical protein [Actinomycetota bacterium]